MPTVIDLGTELLVDRSEIVQGSLRLMLSAVGHPLVAGSPWLVVDKATAAAYRPLLDALRRSRKGRPAA